MRAYSGFNFNSVIFSQTMSSLSYKKAKRNVYHTSTDGTITLGDDNDGVVRCVKDEK